MRKLYAFFLTLFIFGYTAIHGQFTINGHASALGADEFQLTHAGGYAAGSIWNNTLVDLTKNFEINLQLYFGDDDNGADGIAFMLQAEGGLNYLGNYGAGLGYHRFNGIPAGMPTDVPGPVKSLVVEFDTYDNDHIYSQDIGDPVEDHLGFMSMSNAYHSNSTALSPVYPFAVNIEDGIYHNASFKWNASAKVLTVTFLGNTYTYAGDIVNTLFAGNPMVYWGLTASTGSVVPSVQKCKIVKNECNIVPCHQDNIPPVIICPEPMTLCPENDCRYTIPELVATDNCQIAIIGYIVTGATCRIGFGKNASGYFNSGVNYITWKVMDFKGNISTCTQRVTIRGVDADIADAYAVNPGGKPFTIYKGYGGTSLTLTASGSDGVAPYTYKWSNNATTQSITVSPTHPGTYTYTVKVTDALGCSGTKTVKVKVVDVSCGGGNKNHKVKVCHIPPGNPRNKHEICIDKHAVAAHLAHGDKLGDCEDDNRHHDDDDCDRWDRDRYHNNNDRDRHISMPATGTEEVLADAKPAQALVQPNPSRGQFRLQLNAETGSARIIISNTHGAVVETRNVELASKGQPLSFDLSRQPAGVYLVRIITSSGVETRKVLIQK